MALIFAPLIDLFIREEDSVVSKVGKGAKQGFNSLMGVDAAEKSADAQSQMADLQKNQQIKSLAKQAIVEQARQVALNSATGQGGSIQSKAGKAQTSQEFGGGLEFIQESARLGDQVTQASREAAQAAQSRQIISLGFQAATQVPGIVDNFNTPTISAPTSTGVSTTPQISTVGSAPQL